MLALNFLLATRYALLATFSMSSSKDLNIDTWRISPGSRSRRTKKAKFAQQLGDVLHHIEQLGKVDVSGVEPTAHAFPVYNVWADDVVQPGLPVEVALKNAPRAAAAHDRGAQGGGMNHSFSQEITERTENRTPACLRSLRYLR